MSDAEFIRQYRYACRARRALIERMDAAEEEGIRDYATLRQFRVERLRLNLQAREFERILANVRDERLRGILRAYYGDHQTDDRIGEQLGLDGRTVNRLRNNWMRSHSAL